MAVNTINAAGVPIVGPASSAPIVSQHGTAGITILYGSATHDASVVSPPVDRARFARRMVEIEALFKEARVPSAWRAGLPGDETTIAALIEGNGRDKPVVYATPQPWPALDPWRKRQPRGVVHKVNLLISIHWASHQLVNDTGRVDQQQPLVQLVDYYEDRLSGVVGKIDGRRRGGHRGAGVPKQPHTRLMYWWVGEASRDEDVLDMLGRRDEWNRGRDKEDLPIVDIVVRDDAQTVTFKYSGGRRSATFPFKEIRRMISRVRGQQRRPRTK